MKDQTQYQFKLRDTKTIQPQYRFNVHTPSPTGKRASEQHLVMELAEHGSSDLM